MATKTLTAPLAIIEINGKQVGKIKNLRLTENIQRGSVRGCGELTDVEKPVLGLTCTFSASYYTVDLTKLGSIDHPFIKRAVSDSVEVFKNTLLLKDSGVNIHMYRKIIATEDSTTGLVKSTTKEKIGVIYNAFMDSQSFDLAEGQVSGSDLTGTYLDPVIL